MCAETAENIAEQTLPVFHSMRNRFYNETQQFSAKTTGQSDHISIPKLT